MVAAAFLLDVDGTVWDSYPCYAAVLHSRLGLTCGVALDRLRAGGNAVALARNCGLTDATFLRLCRGSLGELRLYPDVLETLREIRRRGTRVGVVTSLPKWLAGPLLSDVGVAPYLDTAVYAARKPNPAGITKAINDMRLDAGDVYYVGDTPKDAIAAERAGVLFAWAEYGYCDERPPETDAVLHSFSDLLGL